jgi:hypothetical protein
MGEPFERRLERKLEARLGVVLAKWEVLAGSTSRHTFTDGYLRALSCIGIFWFPNLLGIICVGRYAPGADGCVAGVLAFVLTIIYAFRATDKLCCAYEDSDAPDKRKRLPFIAGTVLLCWAPVIGLGILMASWLVQAYVR